MKLKYAGIGEASNLLGLSRTSIQRLVDSNELSAVKTVGGHRRVLRSSIEAFSQKMGTKIVHRPAAFSLTGMPLDAATTTAQDFPVLIVEEDAAVAALLVEVLSLECPRMKCTVATDGLDTVLRLDRIRPRILIMGLSMYPFDGLALIRMVAAREEYQSVAMVVISDMSAAELESRGGLPSNVLFFQKPMNLDRFKGFIDAHAQLLWQVLN